MNQKICVILTYASFIFDFRNNTLKEVIKQHLKVEKEHTVKFINFGMLDIFAVI